MNITFIGIGNVGGALAAPYRAKEETRCGLAPALARMTLLWIKMGLVQGKGAGILWAMPER
jgi:hypothetical protein